jgi:hypothetical protein
MQYHTDEELSQATEWILKKNKKNECLTRNVATTEGGTDGTNQIIKRAEKGKTSADKSSKSPELQGNV